MSTLSALLLRLSCVLLAVSCATANAAEPGIKVDALHCEFTLPADYKVQPTSNGVDLYRPGTLARISFRKLRDRTVADTEMMKATAENTGHLQIVRYVPKSKEIDSRLARVVVRGLDDEVDFSFDAMQSVAQVVEQCIATASPKILAFAKRREKGCTLQPRERFTAFFADLKPQVVFSGGGMSGWRLYGAKPRLAELGLQPMDMVTSFCGASLGEILELDGDICCDTALKDKVKLKVTRNGEQVDVTAPLSRQQ